MASIQKTAYGYRAQIRRLGVRASKQFKTKREAVLWANNKELEIMERATKPAGQIYTLREALQKYSKEVSVSKRGAKWEQTRLAAFENYKLPLDVLMVDVTSQHIVDFRDSRAQSIKPGSVIRELNILSAVFTTAVREWGWIESNPCKNVRRPAQPKHRERTIKWHEIKLLLRELGYQKPPETKKQAIALCFLTALATGMRAGELCNLTWDRVFDRHVHLDKTKNGNSRDVPLSKRAKRYIECMRGFDDRLVFSLDSDTLSVLFRRYKSQAGLSGFTFHDARHTAATLLAKKVDVLTLCKIMGWSNPKMAMVYFNPSPSSIADLLG